MVLAVLASGLILSITIRSHDCHERHIGVKRLPMSLRTIVRPYWHRVAPTEEELKARYDLRGAKKTSCIL